jgi:hypothetical protein
MATTPKDTSLSSAFRYAIDQPLENMATTFQALGMEGWEKFMRDLVEEPENYEVAAERFINAQGEGFNWEYFPRAIFEQAGQIAGSLATRAGGAALGATAGPGGAVAGALLGPGLFEAVQIAGPVALERARNEGRTEPNWEDWTGALGTATASGVLNAVGIKNVGVLNSTIKQVGKATAVEGVTEGAQGAIEQIGGTALTDQGLQFDPKAAVGEGLLGAGAGGGTQIGTQAVGQIAPPVQDGTLGANRFLDIKNLFGKKKEVAPEQPTELSIQERIAQTQATAEEKIRRLYPELSPVFENAQDLAFVDDQIVRGTDYELNAKSIEALLPEIDEALTSQAEFNDFDLTPEIRNEIVRELVEDIATHTETYTAESYDEYEAVDPFIDFDTDMVTNTANNMLANYFDTSPKASSALPSGQFEIDEPRPLFNKVPGIPPILESISYARRANPDFDTMPPLGAVNPQFDIRTRNLLQNSPKGPIDPVFMSHSPLWLHLQNVTKKPIPAEDMMKNLFFDVRSAEEVPAAKEHGTFKPLTTEAKKNQIATQAIEARIGEFLLDRANKKQTVTRDEVLKVLQDHRGRFTTTMLSEDGNWIDESEYKTSAMPALEAWSEGKLEEFIADEIKKSDILPDDYDPAAPDAATQAPLATGEDAFFNEYLDVVEPKAKKRLQKELESEGIGALLPFMVEENPSKRAIEPYKPQYPDSYAFSYFLRNQPEFKKLGNAVEIGLKYDPRTSSEVEESVQAVLEETGSLQQANAQKIGDKSFIRNADSAHYWMGPGMLGWIRGGMYSHEDGARGLLLHEIQSHYHASAQDKDGKTKVYRSHVRDASDMTKADKKQLLEGEKLTKAYDAIDRQANVRQASLVLSALGADKGYDETDMPGNSGRLLGGGEHYYDQSPSMANYILRNALPNAVTKGNLENLMNDLYKTEYEPKLTKELKGDLLLEQPLQEVAGYTFKDNAVLDRFVDRVVKGKRGDPNTSSLFGEAIIEAGILDQSATPQEFTAASDEIRRLYDEIIIPDVNRENESKLLKAIEPVAVDIVVKDPNIGQVYTMLTDPKINFPSFREYASLVNMSRAENIEEKNVIADAPLKKDFSQAMVQASISKILMSDPDVNWLYIPNKGYGGAPESIYKNAVKEARRISKQFGLEFKDITEFQDGSDKVKVHGLEIGPLREKIILEGGFPGKMTGGLVKKATNQTFNLGDYGQKFI